MLKVTRSTVHTDSDGDGAVDAGEVLTHTIVIENQDAVNPATGVVVNDTLTGSTAVPGSINVSPIAFNDAYSAVGNTLLLVGGFANPGSGHSTAFSGKVTDNDTDFLGDVSMKVSAVTNGVTAAGGTFNIAADGSFSYISASGYEGTDNFTYTLRDAGLDGIWGNADDLTSVGLVTITVSQTVWFVDANAAAGGNGTSISPFNSLNPLTTGGSHDAFDDASDIIYLKGSVTGSIVLEADQQLIGAGASFTMGALTVSDTGTQAVLNHSGVGVQLATGNTIKGLDIVGTAGGAVGIADGGATVGTLTVSDVGISGQGQIIDVDQGGTLNVTLNSAASTGSTGINGGVIDLTGVGGTFAVSGATTINGAHGQTGIDLTGNTGLTANFNGMVTVNMTGAGSTTNAAVILGSGTNAAVNFTGGLDIDTLLGGGLSVTGTTLSVTGANNTINTAGGAILTMTNALVGAGNINFATLATSATTNGTSISFNNVDGGSFHVDSATVTSNTDGIFIGGGSTTNFDFDSLTAGATSGVGIGISGAGNGTVNFDTVAIDASNGHGVSIQGATSSVTIGGGTIGATNDPAGDGVNISGGTANISIAAAITKTSAGNVVEVNDYGSGTVTFSGALTGGTASNGILVTSVNSGTVNFTGQTALNTGANAAVTLTDNGGGTINFAAAGNGLDITTSTGAGLTFTGGGILNVSGTENTISTGTGSIVNIANGNTGTGITFASLTATGTVAGTAISINNLDGATFAGGPVSIAGTSGATSDGIFLGGGSTSSFTFGNTSIGTTTRVGDEGIEVNGVSGNVSFGSVNVRSTGTAVEMSNSSGTLNLTGGLTADASAGGGLVASGGGTLTIGGTANTINAVGGAGVSIVNTTVGGGSLVFKSVASVGGVNGINLTNIGGASFTVTGDGATNSSNLTQGRTTAGATGNTLGLNSGGTISGSTGAGVVLNGTSNVTLQNMAISTATGGTLNDGRDGINASNSSNLVLDNISITGIANNNGLQATTISGLTIKHSEIGGNATAAGVENIDLWNVKLDNVSGNISVTSSKFETTRDTLFGVVNTAGTTNIVINNSAFRDADVTANFMAGNGIYVESGGTSNVSLGIKNSVFQDFVGKSISFRSLDQAGGGLVDIQNSSFHDDINSIYIQHQGDGKTLRFNIEDNQIRSTSTAVPRISSDAIVIDMAAEGDAATRLEGYITGNTIGNAAVDNSGSVVGNGIFMSAYGGGTMTVAVLGNTIRQIKQESGIRLFATKETATANSPTVNATISNNNIQIDSTAGQALAGVTVEVGAGAIAADNPVLNLNLLGNQVIVGDATFGGIYLSALGSATRGSSPTVRLQGYSGATNNVAQVTAFLGSTAVAPTNSPTAVVSIFNSTVTSVSSVATPSFAQPMFADRSAEQAPSTEVAGAVADDPQQASDSSAPGGAEPSAGGTSPPDAQSGESIPVETGNAAVAPVQEASSVTSGPAPAPAPAQGEPPVVIDDGVLTQAELDFIVEAAIQRWIDAGATPEQVAAMRATTITVADIGGLYLGKSGSGTIQLDDNAAGWSWFVDATPGDDSEFGGSGTQLTATDASGIAGTRMDLLTVVMHELGHQIGLTDIYAGGEADELMYGTIRAGERRLPGADDAAEGGAAPVTGALAIEPITIGTIPAGQTVTIKFKSIVDTVEDRLIGPFTQTTSVSGTNASLTSDSDLSDTFSNMDSLTLGNVVFLDVNKNGVYDAGIDSGISGVSLSLFADTNKNGVYDEGTDLAITYTDTNNNGVYDPGTDVVGGSTILTVTSGANGLYAFSNLAAGDYIVRVNASNFTNGGVLFGKSSTTGETDPDDNVDNDDNGVAASGGIVVSKAIRLDFNSEPTAGAGNDTNNTLDLGFMQLNQAPVFTGLGGDNASYTENAAPVRLDAGTLATIADSDSANFDGGSLAVTFNRQAGDRLIIDNSGTITLAPNAGDPTKLDVYVSGVLIGVAQDHVSGSDSGSKIDFNANATPARVQELVRALYFDSTSQNPATVTRTFNWTLVDGDGRVNGGDDDTSVISTVTVLSVNDAPAGADNGAGVVEAQTLTFTTAHFATGMSDVEGHNFAGVKITTLPSSGTIFFDADGAGGNARVAISAGATFTTQQLADGKLTFVPAAGSGGTAPTFTFQVQDNGGTANGGADLDATPNTFTFTVAHGNQPPVLTTSSGTSVAIEAGSGTNTPVAVDPNITVTDVDNSRLVNATVQVTNGVAGQVVLAFVNNDTALYGDIYVSSPGGPGSAITLSTHGASTMAQWQNALRAVTFTTNTDDPDAAELTVSFVVTDGTSFSDYVTKQIAITPTNDAPVNTVPVAQSGTEDANLVFSAASANAISVTDAEASSMTVALSVLHGKLTLSGTSGLVVNGNGTGNVTLTGSASALNAALNGLTYRGNLNYSGSDTLTVTTSDNGGTGAGGTLTDTDTVTITLTADGKINGTGGNDNLGGTGGNDVFMLAQGGEDTASGGDGNDGFYLGGALSAGDQIDGGAGTNDQVAIQGNYGSMGGAAHLLGAGNLTNVETLVLLSGKDTRFGDAGTSSYSYNLKSLDANVAAGGTLIVNWNQLKSGENVRFDGSAETDGKWVFYAGAGDDTIIGGSGNDGFYFGADLAANSKLGFFSAADRIDGGEAAGDDDQIALRGDHDIVMDADTIRNIETVVLLSGKDTRFGSAGPDYTYKLKSHDANLGAGETLTVQAGTLRATETIDFDGSLETDGKFRFIGGEGNDIFKGGAGDDFIWGGAGADLLEGGAGNDSYVYRAGTDSNSAGMDLITGFGSGDLFDLTRIDANGSAAGDGAFTFVGSAAFTGQRGELRTYQSNGLWYVEGDIDGDGSADLVISVNVSNGYTLSANDFLL
jgi:hypothetical protein